MNTKIFKKWNWEYDFGQGELSENDELPRKHAIVFRDQFNRIYRV